MPKASPSSGFQAAIAFLNVVLHIYSDFGTALLVDDWRQLEPFFKNVAISHAFLGVPFLSFMCVSTRLWFMYISKAVALYVACIHRSLGCCLRSRSTPNRRKALLVDRMRVQLGLLGSCVKLASWLLGPSLLYAYAYSVPILCAAAYYTIVPELKFRIRLFFLFFWMLHWLSILLPVITAQRMKRAMMELRGAIQQASMTTYSEELLAQLRMMLNWSKHNDLQFTGSGFFVVDVSTFTQMMGAVITYTVVLVQTSNSYQRGSLQQCTKRIVD
ncbi:uncharacterized protein LOC144162092 isoform X3 [Haemaphysalis longicornis]